MTEDESEVLDAVYTEKKTEPPKPKPGLLNRFAKYVHDTQEANLKAGLKPLSEELGEAGAGWLGGIGKGMASVGDEFEAELTGKKKTQPVQQQYEYTTKSTPVKRGMAATEDGELFFIDELCSFLRFVQEDDEVMLWKVTQIPGKHFLKIDNVYLGKLLTRFYGHKITIKERDLMFK
jgi:hypothetical protein